ncbi:MAG: metallophosphoesterase [Alphaproteobacteria bacterium]|nr:metallophosphoesterase [Alphaproteobacteria bacterium]MCB9699269.1 metallophosphoesterase [Alphaproteobacteria bacterium]
MLLLLAACNGPTSGDATDRAPDTDESGSTPTVSQHSASSADTGPPPPPPPPPDLCWPDIGVPGTIEGDAIEPHAEVYGPGARPELVRLGWPGTDLSRSVSFLWKTDTITLASQVELTEDGGATRVIDGASFLYGSDGGQRVHEVKLCLGVKPATTYTYRVGGPSSWSSPRTFTTPAAPGQLDTVRVAFGGDSRGSYAQWALLVRTAATWNPDLFVFTGDAVDSGTSQAQWDSWLEAGADLFDHVPLIAAHGNHEGQAVHWFAQVSYPNDELSWPVRYGPLQLLFLNDTTTDADLDAQITLIDEVFGTSDATWKVAVHHQSPYSTCDRHGSNTKVRDRWTPRYEAGGVDLVLCGHNHIYERSVPILADAVAEPGPGVTYIVTGGAGAPLYTAFTPAWFSNVVQTKKHFGIADFGPDRVDVQVFDGPGNLIDAFSLPADRP